MTPVETLNKEYETIVKFLREQSQPSLVSDVDRYFKKLFVLSSASYFEHLIQEILVEFISKETNNNLKAVSFFKKKAIGMQYHTYFNWGEKGDLDKPGKNANTFFSLFGDEFKKEVEAEINTDKELELSVKAFLEIGHIRNILIHSNFAAYNLDNKTANEIFELYKKGFQFINYLKTKFQQNT
ncbi:HEPN domain-containing protein [Candidatus Methylobacter oryzae]|uniref:RiboL-PSP-HEPN domain-containing protein n=1 Tax=Candidatus Methylobacter oryzae TaxID=2497749 RepID=A0ABY3CFM2_9GAMM|nr:HEPN domain-containing protein [Candidatus Methylobacter oryzae]TRX02099.1 hypothetical protein EKO24_002945 [Candidatus Methylobacter oryzae]